VPKQERKPSRGQLQKLQGRLDRHGAQMEVYELLHLVRCTRVNTERRRDSCLSRLQTPTSRQRVSKCLSAKAERSSLEQVCGGTIKLGWVRKHHYMKWTGSQPVTSTARHTISRGCRRWCHRIDSLEGSGTQTGSSQQGQGHHANAMFIVKQTSKQTSGAAMHADSQGRAEPYTQRIETEAQHIIAAYSIRRASHMTSSGIHP
jgi:hypothetical protein